MHGSRESLFVLLPAVQAFRCVVLLQLIPDNIAGILFIYGLGSIIGRGKGTRGHVIYPQVPQAQGFLMDNEFRYARFQFILHKADSTVT